MARACASWFLTRAAVLQCGLLCAGLGLAQNSLDEIHISPPSPRLQNAAVRETFPDAPIIHKSVDLVMVPVTITDDKDRLITGLDRQNFQVFDGKQRQEIKHFSSEDQPVSLGIVLDLSGSMSDKLERARQAVLEFCKTANPLDEFFMVTFGNEPQLALDFTQRTEDLQSQLALVSARGRTALLDAIFLSLNQMRHARYEKRALLIISDGGDNHSRYTESEIRSMVKEADVEIYSIGIFDRNANTPEEVAGPVLLEDLTAMTGGRAFTIENVNLLPAVAVKIGTELRNQYILAYSPDSSMRNGKWHKIKIKLSLPRGLWPVWIHAKSGYYAAAR